MRVIGTYPMGPTACRVAADTFDRRDPEYRRVVVAAAVAVILCGCDWGWRRVAGLS